MSADNVRYCDGAIMALAAVGQQDAYTDCQNCDWHDARRLMLAGRAQMAYGRLPCLAWWSSPESRGRGHELTFTFERRCDLVTAVDLILPPGVQLSDVSCIEVTVAGQRVDILKGDEKGGIDVALRASCALLGRCVTQKDGTTVAALPLAPLHRHNLVPPSLKLHELQLRVKFSRSFSEKKPNVELWGEMYYIEDRATHLGFNGFRKDAETTMMTLQHQQTSAVLYRGCGIRTLSVPLNFHYPTALLYFYGVRPITRVKKVTLQVNGHDFYNGDLLPLLHRSRAMLVAAGYPVGSLPEEVALLSFVGNLGFSRRQAGSINFSRMDSASLLLEVEDATAEETVHVVGLSFQPVIMKNGMLSLLFAR
jgi:hypothetical protein